ncbi:flagellar hook-associated protein FlgL [Pseudoalteromonas sp. SS15]|uniref:flagellar hook-associated protein FlgL n=1 Tax=Pseudoalteromonas sp. SS15 TaxID=3139393 RepID=UPI003BAB15FA
MRLSNNLIYKQNIGNVLDKQQMVMDAQQRVNTQKKFLGASEDPSAFTTAQLLTDRIQMNEQHQKNAILLNARLTTEESVLNNINDTLFRVEMLTIQAGNGAHNEIDRQSIASELKEIQKSMLNLMNAQSEDGRYIFSGYQDQTQTYLYNPDTEKYEYQGDQGLHSIPLAENVRIGSSDNGFEVFENVDARLDVVSYNGAATSTATGTVYVENQDEFDLFHKENFDRSPSAPVGANTYNVVITPPVSNITSSTYEIMRNGVPLVPPITGDLDGETIQFNGLKIDIPEDQTGQFDFELEPLGKENILNTIDQLIIGLEDETLDNDQYRQYLADALVQVKNSSEQISFTQSRLGGRLNALERVMDSNESLDINNKASRSDLVEVDIAEAISDLTKHETALQASHATFGRLANMSLLDYI